MASYDAVKANSWLIETSKDPRWSKRVEDPKPREKVVLIPEGARLKAAKILATQGWIPHHETGEKRPVSSPKEALIILDYAARCKGDPETPLEVLQMTSEEEEGLTAWLHIGRM